MLIWCLKKVKDLILKFLINKSFLSEKEFLNLHTILLVSFPSGGCVAKFVHNRESHQGFEYDCCLTVIHFMNG